MEEQKNKQTQPYYLMQIYAKSKALTVEPYNGDKDCERYITVDEAIKICEEALTKAIPLGAEVKPESTDIEKQENIVTILYEFIDNMIKDDAYKDYQKGYSTHGIREAVGTALEKILKLDNLKIREVQ